MIYLTRRFEFCAAHRAYVPALSKEENLKLFGNESFIDGHGHNYTLELTIHGTTNPDTGLVINLTDIKTIINSAVIDNLDHKYFNELEYFKGVNPSLEHLAKVVWKLAADSLASYKYCELDKIKITEGRDSWVEYGGEGA